MLASVLGLTACSTLKLPAGAEAGEAGAPAASASAAAAPEAANATEMTRYPDEKPVDHAPITAESNGNLRTEAGAGGDLVIVLKRGTEVEKLAEHGGYYLVEADDPKDTTRKLMGWVSESVFTSGGERPEPEHNEHGGGNAPPSPVPKLDAGLHAVVDAGGAKPPAPAPGPAKPLDVHKANGACPPGYAPCAAVCRLSCKTDAECGDPAAHCSAGFCLGPRAVPCK
jgi:hypothetical protein